VSDTRRTSWTAKELLEVELPEPRCAVDDLITEGLTFECGAPKIGKSWLGLGLGIAVAAGGFAFGKIKVEQGDVLYLALEDNPRRLQTRLRMLLGQDSPPDGLDIETEWERFDRGGMERLEAWLDGHPSTRLVVIDVWTRIRPFASNHTDRYQADYEAASAVQALGIRRGVAVLALYHTRKAESSDFVETVQGTFGTAGAADTIIVIKCSRGEADATLYVTGRDVEERELALQFSPESGTWSLLGDAAEYTLGETRKLILETVTAHGALTPKQVSELTVVGHELAKKTMQRMFLDGQLAADGGKYSIPLQIPVPGVPQSPDQGQRDSGDSDPEGDE
jgi:AAA domain